MLPLFKYKFRMANPSLSTPKFNGSDFTLAVLIIKMFNPFSHYLIFITLRNFAYP